MILNKIWKGHGTKMAMGITVLAILLLASSASAIPVEEWNKTFGGAGRDLVFSVQQTSDSGYIIGGMAQSFKPDNMNAWLLKIDSQGNQQWNKTFGKGWVMSVDQTSDGGYIFTGRTSDAPISMKEWVVKINNNGNQQWNKTFFECAGATSVQQTLDGGYTILCLPTELADRNILLIKTDSIGNPQWNKTFERINGRSVEGPFAEVKQTSDGGYIISGNYAWLIKTDVSGNMLWKKPFGGDIQQTSDGGYIIASVTNSFGAGKDDILLIKTDASGNQQWNKTFGGKFSEWARSVQQTSDGGYIIAGYTDSYGAGSDDVWLVKTDANGNQQWNKTFGGKGDDGATYVQQTIDGSYTIAGYTNSYGAGDYDIWLIKVSRETESPIKASSRTDTASKSAGTAEKAAGFEAILSITTLSVVYIFWRKRR